RRHAHIWLGVAMGAYSHLWRDMGTGTVALVWPITETVYGTPFNRYLALLTGIALAMVGSAALLDPPARAAGHETPPPSRAPAPPRWPGRARSRSTAPPASASSPHSPALPSRWSAAQRCWSSMPARPGMKHPAHLALRPRRISRGTGGPTRNEPRFGTTTTRP